MRPPRPCARCRGISNIQREVGPVFLGAPPLFGCGASGPSESRGLLSCAFSSSVQSCRDSLMWSEHQHVEDQKSRTNGISNAFRTSVSRKSQPRLLALLILSTPLWLPTFGDVFSNFFPQRADPENKIAQWLFGGGGGVDLNFFGM